MLYVKRALCTLMDTPRPFKMKTHSEFEYHDLMSMTVRSLFDATIVGGLTFFSTALALGGIDALVDLKPAFLSSVMMAGLSFFTELRNKSRHKRKKGERV